MTYENVIKPSDIRRLDYRLRNLPACAAIASRSDPRVGQYAEAFVLEDECRVGNKGHLHDRFPSLTIIFFPPTYSIMERRAFTSSHLMFVSLAYSKSGATVFPLTPP